jgi:hypothetical protein
MLSAMRDIDVIESELRLLAAVRRSCQELGGRTPSTRLIDSLLDERASSLDHQGSGTAIQSG